MATRSNRPRLDELTPAQRIAVDDGAQALKELQDFRRLTFDKWMTVARGVAPLVELAERPGMSRTARKTFLKENGYGTLNKSTVVRLVLMAEHETAIRAWRDELTPNKRDAWNSPTSICNRCPAVRAVMATASKTPARRRPSRMNFELALDAVAESWNAADADGRAVITERLSRMMDPPPPSIDEAIEMIRDYLDELVEAERRTFLTELVEEFGFALLDEEKLEAPKPARKRRSKKAPAVAGI